MGGTLVGRKETAEGDHGLGDGKHVDRRLFILTPPRCFTTAVRSRCLMEYLSSSHRWAMRRSVSSSSPEQQLQRRRSQSCSTTLTITWAGQQVTRCSVTSTPPRCSVELSFATTCRYKEEISHLCKEHGTQEAGRSQRANSALH